MWHLLENWLAVSNEQVQQLLILFHIVTGLLPNESFSNRQTIGVLQTINKTSFSISLNTSF